MNRLVFIGLIASLLLAACGPQTVPTPEIIAGAIEAVAAEPSATPTPTDTPTPLPTSTPTETPIPLHPLNIEAMRQVEYPGSELVFEETLEPGANYDRYIVSYLSEDNKIYALLTVPRGEKPETGWPVIIFNHGFIPPEVYRTTERYVAYVDGFARQGYIVLRSDYRGHGFSEGEASGGYSTPAYTVDVLNAVASIKMYPDADPNGIGMWGHSMGGQITLRSMVVTDDIKGGVIWGGMVAPYSDIIERSRRRREGRPTPTPDPSGAPDRRRWSEEFIEMYGDWEQNPEFWASIAPNGYLEDLSGPIQLHHAEGDESVPVEFSRTLEAQMKALGLYVDPNYYEGDDHDITENFTTAMRRSIFFFDEYVKNIE